MISQTTRYEISMKLNIIKKTILFQKVILISVELIFLVFNLSAITNQANEMKV